jgi:hypothetical protein
MTTMFYYVLSSPWTNLMLIIPMADSASIPQVLIE